MTSFVSATYDTDKDQIFDPNFNSPSLGLPANIQTDASGMITLAGWVEVDARAYGVVANGKAITGFSIVPTSTNVGTASATVDTFTRADVGKRLACHKGSGVSSMLAYPTYNGTIVAYIDPRNVTVALTSCPTLNTGSPYGAFGTDNGDQLNAAVNALSKAAVGGVLQLPAGLIFAYPFRSSRANSTVYGVGTYRIPATPTGYYYKAIIGGQSGASIPAAFLSADTYGNMVTDGEITWMCMGQSQLVMPAGSVLQGRGRAVATPFGYVTKGTCLMSCGFDNNSAAFVSTPAINTNGCQFRDLTIDAHKCSSSALKLNGSGGGNLVHNVSLMRGFTATVDNSTGSATWIGCHIAGGYDPAYVVSTGGDSRFADCLIHGGGANFATVRAANVTDDFSMSGCHLYRGAWSANTTLASLPGPQLLMDSTFASGSSNGGIIANNVFDTCYGNHIELSVTGATSDAFEALTIANNQFYNPVNTVPDNTFSCIKITADAAAPLPSYTGLSISGNVGKGTPSGNACKSFIDFNLNAAGQFAGNTIGLNAIQNCAARYTGATLPDFVAANYSGGNVTRTTAGVVTVG